ncbi:MAG: glycosyltransferase family 2 protein [Stellaceae bacterium]
MISQSREDARAGRSPSIAAAVNDLLPLSVVIPVFNKADILPEVVRSLAAQTIIDDAEIVFVDDASTDGSRNCLRALADRLPRCIIVSNATNSGPAIRLNQGAALARGRRICLLDADVLPAPDAAERMIEAMVRTGAPMLHGRTTRVAVRQDHLPRLPPLGCQAQVRVSDHPLKSVLRGGFVRMGWMVEAALFREAGGCDERIFIQDESLPLRLAARAGRIAWITAAVAQAPRVAFHVSSDRRQLHHDAFFAHYNLLRDRPDLPPGLRRGLAERCISTAWKAVRKGGLRRRRLPLLINYVLAKGGASFETAPALEALAEDFRLMKGIRRPAAPLTAPQ